MKIVKEKKSELNVKEINKDSGSSRIPSHYSDTEKSICIDINKDPWEFLMTFRHEMGHFIDDSCDRISMTENFKYSIDADKDQYDRGTEYGMSNFQRLINELSQNNEVLSDRYVSDILSALFNNDTAIRKTYYQAYFTFFKHSTEYWAEIDGPVCAVQKEIFADMFAIYTTNNKVIISFVERNFPNISSRFKKEIISHG